MVDHQRLYEVKTATIQNFAPLWVSNFEANKSRIHKAPGVASLFERFQDIPAIVVGAGPSLDKNMIWLREAQDKAIIIAVDTIFSSLMKAGINPTVVVTLDPQADVARFLDNVDSSRKLLVAPTIAHPQALDRWNGDIVFYNKYAPDIPELTRIASINPGLGYLIPGGSVLSVGLDLEYRMGANPIGFVGQDLSYPSKGAAYAGDTLYGDGDYETLFSQRMEQMVTETDIFGRSVWTQKSMFVTKQWMEWAFTSWKRKNHADFYNLTEGGIVTQHCNIISLKEWVTRFCHEKKNLEWGIKKALKRKK